MPRLLALLALPLLALPALADSPPRYPTYWVYVGTYTAKDGSKGVYRCQFDSNTGTLSEPEVAAEVGSPSFLHVAPDGKSLYAVGEAAGKDGGGVYSWKLDPATGKLSDQVSLTSKGAGPCHISTDAKNQFAVVANYGGGSTTLFKLKADGALDSLTGFLQHEGKVFDAKRQGGPHAHCGFFDPTGSVVYVPDLGLDKVMIHKLDPKTGEITANDPAFVKLPDRTGPRHITFTADGGTGFVCGEIDMTVHVLKLDVKGNKFEAVSSASTLPADEKATDKMSTAEVRMHPTGKWVYVSNRGHNSIAAFSYDADKMKLTPTGHMKGEMKTPRNFNLTPDGRWMFVCSQDGAKVTVWGINSQTGLATETKTVAKVSNPVCVKFVAKP